MNTSQHVPSDGVGVEDEALGQEALREMGLYHSPQCERGHKNLSDGPGRIRMDAPCERCRYLWTLLDEARDRRVNKGGTSWA
jgi:hypothetical protein